jgi:hypothetical protein
LQIKIAFITQNTIQNIENISCEQIYTIKVAYMKMICLECPLKYIGQTEISILDKRNTCKQLNTILVLDQVQEFPSNAALFE